MQVPALWGRVLRSVAAAVLALATGMACGLGVLGVAAPDTNGTPAEAAAPEWLPGGIVDLADAIGVQPSRGPTVERASNSAGMRLVVLTIAVLAAGVAALVTRRSRPAADPDPAQRRSVLWPGPVGRRAPPIAPAA